MTTGSIYFPPNGTADYNGRRSGHFESRNWSGTDDKKNHKTENPYVSTTTAGYDPLMGPSSVGRYLCASWLVNSGYTQNWNGNSDVVLYNKLGRKMKGHEFNGLVTAVEAKESLNMIADTSRTLAKAVWYTYRGNFMEAARALNLSRVPRLVGPDKRFASNWLAMKLGWFPLASDMVEAARAVAALTNRPSSLSFVASHRVGGTFQKPGDFGYKECWISKRIKYTLKEDFSPLTNLGFTDPLPAIWEAIPYSFVFDWAIPIGSFLEARGFANRLQGTYVITTREKVYTRKLLPTSTLDAWYYMRNSKPEAWYKSYHKITRTVGSGALPSVRFPSPKPLNQWLDWKKAITGISLLIQRSRDVQDNGFTYG